MSRPLFVRAESNVTATVDGKAHVLEHGFTVREGAFGGNKLIAAFATLDAVRAWVTATGLRRQVVFEVERRARAPLL